MPPGFQRSKKGNCYANMDGAVSGGLLQATVAAVVLLAMWFPPGKTVTENVFTKDLVELEVMPNCIKQHKSKIT